MRDWTRKEIQNLIDEEVITSLTFKNQWERFLKNPTDDAFASFCKRQHRELDKFEPQDEAKVAWQEYMLLRREYEAITLHIAESTEANVNDLAELYTFEKADNSRQYERLAEISKRQEELYPLANEWNMFTSHGERL